MARSIPNQRHAQADRARNKRTMLLPLPRNTADEIALRVYLALEVMHRGCGSEYAAQTLAQTMVLCGFLAQARYGKLTHEQFQQAETDIHKAFERGQDTGQWRFNDDEARRFSEIVTTYDRQLQRAPLRALAEASERLDRYRANGPFETAERRQA